MNRPLLNAKLPHPCLLVSAWWGWSIGGLGLAQEPTSVELMPWVEAERSLLREKAPMVVATLRDQRLRLVRIEKALVSQRDYIAAEETRRARQATEEKLRSWQEALGQPILSVDEKGAITLGAERAILQGGLAFDSTRQRVVGWTQRGLFARWELPANLAAGAYEVSIDYSCAPQEGGSVILKESFFTLTRKIQPTSGWEDRQTRALGIIRLQSGAESLVVEVQNLTQSELFRLYQIRLVPVS